MSVRHTTGDETDVSKLALEQSHQHLTLGSSDLPMPTARVGMCSHRYLRRLHDVDGAADLAAELRGFWVSRRLVANEYSD